MAHVMPEQHAVYIWILIYIYIIYILHLNVCNMSHVGNVRKRLQHSSMCLSQGRIHLQLRHMTRDDDDCTPFKNFSSQVHDLLKWWRKGLESMFHVKLLKQAA